MHYCLIVLLILVVILFILLVRSNSRESFGPGHPFIPMYIPIPQNLQQTQTYLDFSDPAVLQKICPTPRGEGKWCKNHDDCPGEGELCYNSAWGWVSSDPDFVNPQPESNYCVCSIQSVCQIYGVC